LPAQKKNTIPPQRLRVGFLFTAGNHRGFLRVHRFWLENLDPRKYVTVCICPAEIVNECMSIVKRNDIEWVPLAGPLPQMAATMQEAQCDLLYHWKVGGGVIDYFLGMIRAARVHCTSYGTHGTSGVANMDFYLTSPYLDPENVDANEQYTEKLYYFKHHIGFLSQLPEPTGVKRNEFNLPEAGPLFFCPHRLSKYHSSFDILLFRILDRLPLASIVLLTKTNTKGDAVLRQRLSSRFPPDFFNRIHFRSMMDHERLGRLISLSDAILDSPVYAGSLTSYDAFACATPVVSLPGSLTVQCYTAGLYRRMEMPEMIPQNQNAYVELAVRLATDEEFRDQIVEKIKINRKKIFADPQCLIDFELFIDYATAIR
jgi:predicted O-linked N-acetylglucosamine transferase (SPINDLY family)